MVKRLFANQLEASEKFKNAHKFIWTVNSQEKDTYQILTSNYWISKEDIADSNYEKEIKNYEVK